MGADWHGWIMVVVSEDRKVELEAMGIELGPYDPSLEIFKGCLLSDGARVRLMRHRGEYLWKLSRVRRS